MTISIEKENTKIDKNIIKNPLKIVNNTKEVYVEGYEYLGKQIERVRDKSLDISSNEFLVNTSAMNTPLTHQQTIESKSIR